MDILRLPFDDKATLLVENCRATTKARPESVLIRFQLIRSVPKERDKHNATREGPVV